MQHTAFYAEHFKTAQAEYSLCPPGTAGVAL